MIPRNGWLHADDIEPTENGFYRVWLIADDGDGQVDDWPSWSEWRRGEWSANLQVIYWWPQRFATARAADNAKTPNPY
jgi:hypothetical protein